MYVCIASCIDLREAQHLSILDLAWRRTPWYCSSLSVYCSRYIENSCADFRLVKVPKSSTRTTSVITQTQASPAPPVCTSVHTVHGGRDWPDAILLINLIQFQVHSGLKLDIGTMPPIWQSDSIRKTSTTTNAATRAGLSQLQSRCLHLSPIPCLAVDSNVCVRACACARVRGYHACARACV